jgi:hypothetical protein
MAVDLKGIALEMGEENAKVLIKKALVPLLQEKIDANPALKLILDPLLAELEQLALGLAEKINPAD